MQRRVPTPGARRCCYLPQYKDFSHRCQAIIHPNAVELTNHFNGTAHKSVGLADKFERSAPAINRKSVENPVGGRNGTALANGWGNAASAGP
jgi:hypothetical protein